MRQLAPEDIIGVPQIVDGRSIAREEPYCLFLDELNACSHEVQKAFCSLIEGCHRRMTSDGSVCQGLAARFDEGADGVANVIGNF